MSAADLLDKGADYLLDKGAADLLDKGADYLDERGWLRGQPWDYDNPNGPCCMLGALSRIVAPGQGDEYDKAHDAVRSEIRANHRVPVGKATIPYFNDSIAKRRRDCTRLMRRVAKKLRAES